MDMEIGEVDYLVTQHPAFVCAKLQVGTDSLMKRYIVIPSNVNVYVYPYLRMGTLMRIHCSSTVLDSGGGSSGRIPACES